MGDRDPALRISVLQHLADVGGPAAIMVMGQAIMGDRDAQVDCVHQENQQISGCPGFGAKPHN